MTREAKIGMLTGLGVIVLIGVLLSEYLEMGTALGGGPAVRNEATGQMAPLPVGEGYRKQVMEPIGGVAGVPGMNGGGTQVAGGGGVEIVSPINTSNEWVPAVAYAAAPGEGSGEPRVSGWVSPIGVGPSPVAGQEAGRAGNGGPPVIMLADGPHTAPAGGATVNGYVGGSQTSGLGTGQQAGAVQPMIYEIAQGDTLSKIARKFYNSSKISDVQRIVAANSGTLKDANTTLVQSKKLVIPGVTPMVPVSKVVMPDPRRDLGVIGVPGDSGSLRKVEVPKKDATRIYEVQSGDTLEKIAESSPLKTTEMVQKLMSMNGIKDPHGLQIGSKLKVPV